jgi:hypothetical protein
MKKTILAILAITSLLLLHAQENAAPQVEQQEQPAVTSQKRLRELTLAELDQKNHRAREAGEIAAKFKNISTIQNVDLRITEYLRLQKRIAKLQKEIQNANSRQADLAEEIRAGLLDTKLSLQESQRLVECRQYMDEFARAQRLMALQLKKLSDNIQGLILKMPPPPTYTTRSGLKMRLVGTLPNALYISENCVPDALFDEVRSAKALQREPFISADYPNTSAVASYTQALAFCKWLSAYEFNNYVLPDLKQLQILPDFNALPEKAVWSATIWSPDDVNYSRATERFGIKLQTVWDPQHLLSDLEYTGELPDASYKNLSFLVITHVKTGIRQRLEALVKAVNEEKPEKEEPEKK